MSGRNLTNFKIGTFLSPQTPFPKRSKTLKNRPNQIRLYHLPLTVSLHVKYICGKMIHDIRVALFLFFSLFLSLQCAIVMTFVVLCVTNLGSARPSIKYCWTQGISALPIFIKAFALTQGISALPIFIKAFALTQGISALPIFIKAFALKNFLTDCKNHVSISTLSIKIILSNSLTLSWRRPYSYRNQSTDSLRNSMDWFLYDDSLRHERVKSLNQVVISHLYIIFA